MPGIKPTAFTTVLTIQNQLSVWFENLYIEETVNMKKDRGEWYLSEPVLDTVILEENCVN